VRRSGPLRCLCSPASRRSLSADCRTRSLGACFHDTTEAPAA
jgi:hypothetical protein